MAAIKPLLVGQVPPALDLARSHSVQRIAGWSGLRTPSVAELFDAAWLLPDKYREVRWAEFPIREARAGAERIRDLIEAEQYSHVYLLGRQVARAFDTSLTLRFFEWQAFMTPGGHGYLAAVSPHLAPSNDWFRAEGNLQTCEAWWYEQVHPVSPFRRTTLTDCIEWSGYRLPSGYGKRRFQGRQWLAHRAAWVEAHGPIPDGLIVMHTCDNPPCINPEHLRLGTYADNSRDMAAKGRAAAQQKTECPRGHPYAEHLYVGPDGKRRCRTCERDRQAAVRG